MQFYYFPTMTGASALTAGQSPVPKPGEGEVLVKMHAASLNYRDLFIADGKNPIPVCDRLVPLSDGAGEIVSVHPSVSRWAVGDRVAGNFMQAWIDGELPSNGSQSVLGGPVQGVLTEYRVFPQEGLVRVPDHLSWAEASTLPCAALTAWSALFGYVPLKKDDWVLILGTGGVATFALQFAAAVGALPIVASSSHDKLQRARALGAVHGINYRETPEWAVEVRRITQGLGVDHVIEVGGGGTLERSLASARVGGLVHMIGVLARGQMDPRAIMASGAVVRGVRNGSRRMFEDMNHLIAEHRIRPVVDQVFPMDRVQDAYAALAGAGHVGKIVVQISPDAQSTFH